MKPLRLICFNIHGGRDLGGERDLSRIRQLLDDYDIDIGVFQEMETRTKYRGTPQDVSLLAGPDRPHHIPGPSLHDGTGWYGNLIISRFPILKGYVHNLETRMDLEPRCAVDALIDTPLGKIRVIGTHLSLKKWERFSEAKNLINLINQVEQTERNPIFLLGDLNEWRDKSKLIKHLNSLMTPLPCTASFPSFLPLLKLDRAWHDAKSMKVTARTLSSKSIKKLSDHLPIVVEVSQT